MTNEHDTDTPARDGEQEAARLLGLRGIERDLLLALLVAPWVVVGTVVAAVALHRPVVLLGLLLSVPGIGLGWRAVVRHSRRAPDHLLVGASGRRELRPAALLLLAGLCLPLWLVARG